MAGHTARARDPTDVSTLTHARGAMGASSCGRTVRRTSRDLDGEMITRDRSRATPHTRDGTNDAHGARTDDGARFGGGAIDRDATGVERGGGEIHGEAIGDRRRRRGGAHGIRRRDDAWTTDGGDVRAVMREGERGDGARVMTVDGDRAWGG